MEIETSKLSGAALDWAVDKCEDRDMYIDELGEVCFRDGDFGDYSSDWSQGGLIIEREEIDLSHVPFSEGTGWHASLPHLSIVAWGKTPLEAAMRCHVMAKLGEYVDVPDVLLEVDVI